MFDWDISLSRLNHPAVWIFLLIIFTSTLTTTYLVYVVDIQETFDDREPVEEPDPEVNGVSFSFESYDVSSSGDTVNIVMNVDSIDSSADSVTVVYFIDGDRTVVNDVTKGGTFEITAEYGQDVRVGYLTAEGEFEQVESFEAV